jgi:hypothetical protein
MIEIIQQFGDGILLLVGGSALCLLIKCLIDLRIESEEVER